MSIAELNGEVVEALKQAMKAAGVEGNAAAFTRLLRGVVGEGPDPTTVGRWVRGDQTIPAWALLAASRISGMSASDLLLPAPDVVDLRQAVRRLEAQVAELRTPGLASVPEAIPRPAGAHGVAPVRLLAELREAESEVMVLGQQLGCTWEAAEDEGDADPLRVPQERLVSRIGVLEARVAEVASLVDAPYGDYPSPPQGSTDAEVSGWVDDVIQVVRGQVAEIRRRAKRLDEGQQGHRRADRTAG